MWDLMKRGAYMWLYLLVFSIALLFGEGMFETYFGDSTTATIFILIITIPVTWLILGWVGRRTDDV